MLEILPITNVDIPKESNPKIISGIDVNLPEAKPKDVARVVKMLKNDAGAIQDRSLEQIISTLDRVSKIWLDPKSSFRREAVFSLCRLLSQSEKMVKKNLDLAAQFFSREYLERLLRFEIGNKDGKKGKEYVDGWVDEGLYHLHLAPRPGVIFHSLSGNALIVPFLSIAFGMLAKKANILKLPSDEPYLAHAIVRSLIEVDPSLIQAINCMYWSSKDKKVYEKLFSQLGDQYVIHWGTAEATFAIENYCERYKVRKFVKHGPKVSFEVIERPEPHDYRKIAAEIIENDVLYWEQAACTSARFIFVLEGAVSAKQFVKALCESFEMLSQRFPRSKKDDMTPIEQSEGKYFQSENGSWQIVFCENKPEIRDITLCHDRVIYIAPIKSLDEVIEYIDEKRLGYFLQTLGYNGENMKFCEQVGKRGATLITYPGDMNYHMPGTAHDGMHNLHQLMDATVITRQKKIDLMQDGLYALKISQVHQDDN